MKTLESKLVLLLLIFFFVTSVAFFYLPFLPWNFHGPAGLVAAVMTILHIVMNRKTVFFHISGIKSKKIHPKAKFIFYVNTILLLVWTVAALSGIIRLLQRLFLRQVLEHEGPYPDSILVPIHLWFVLATIVMIILHFILHIPHIKAGLKKKKNKESKAD